MTAKITRLFPGLLLVIVVGLVAKFCSSFVAIGSVAVAILLGTIVGTLVPIGESSQTGVRFAEKQVLGVAIMLMGAQLDGSVLQALGLKTVVLILCLVCSAVLGGYLMGRWCGLSSSFSLLLGIGNGICGSSAIAGAAPLIDAKEEETGLSISVVNLLGTLGIFLVPLLANLALEATTVKRGIIIGGTLQAVGQVTAAGFGISDEVGEIATVVKMGRILLLGPVLLLLSLVFRGKSQDTARLSRLPVPWFIVGFVLLMVAVNLHLIPASWIPTIGRLSKELLIVAMAGVGLRITFSSIVRQGPRALLAGAMVFLVQIGLGLGFLAAFY